MKRTLSTVLTVALLLALIPGVTGCKKIIPKKWYESTLEYYRDGVKNGFKSESTVFRVPSDLKDKNNRIGYLLTDLNKDGTDELLIGIIDDSPAPTKFTNVIVCHTDLGPYSLLSSGNGTYISLCYDGVILMDAWEDDQYMRWDQKSNAFNLIDGEGKYLPMKWELTEF